MFKDLLLHLMLNNGKVCSYYSALLLFYAYICLMAIECGQLLSGLKEVVACFSVELK